MKQTKYYIVIRAIIGNIKFTRILAYASFALALILGSVQLVKFINERNKPIQPSITPEAVQQLINTQQGTQECLRELQQTILMTDTSVKRIKVVKK